MEERYNDETALQQYESVFQGIKNTIERKIIQYRFGIGNRIYYKFDELKLKLLDDGLIVNNREEIILAEKRFLRLFKRRLLKPHYAQE